MTKTPKIFTELYVLVLDGAILTPDSFTKYWKNYGAAGGSIYGWRPPKKIYYTLGTAKAGLAHVPDQIRSKVEIHRFTSAGKVLETDQVLKDYEERKVKKELAEKAQQLKWKEEALRRAEAALTAQRAELQSLYAKKA